MLLLFDIGFDIISGICGKYPYSDDPYLGFLRALTKWMANDAISYDGNVNKSRPVVTLAIEINSIFQIAKGLPCTLKNLILCNWRRIPISEKQIA